MDFSGLKKKIFQNYNHKLMTFAYTQSDLDDLRNNDLTENWGGPSVRIKGGGMWWRAEPRNFIQIQGYQGENYRIRFTIHRPWRVCGGGALPWIM